MSQRNTIFVESATVIHQQAYEEGQYLLRLAMPKTAKTARAGQFIHIQCSDQLLMRRPYSILSVSPEAGWVDVYYRATGKGGELLSTVMSDSVLDCMAPIGNGFTLHEQYPMPLLLGGGVGMPPILFLADQMAQSVFQWQPVALLASERPLPFTVCEAKQTLGYAQASATLNRLEEQGITGRLCSKQSYPGFFNGYIDQLANDYLNNLDHKSRSQVEIFACGPSAMLESVARLARQYELPCQICVEEYMACGVGGCAGCTIKVKEKNQYSMQRVCVDGPVFSAKSVYPAG